MDNAVTSPDGALRDEILAEARARADRALDRARQEAAAVLEKARSAAAADRERRLGEARAEGARRAGIAMARGALEAGRLRAARVESLLLSIRDEARRRLLAREGFEYRASLAALAAEGVRGIAGDRFVVTLPEGDRPLADAGWLEEVRRLAGRPGAEIRIEFANDSGAGGPVVRDDAGRQAWDNRLDARLDRMWPDLRRELGGITGLADRVEPREAAT